MGWSDYVAPGLLTVAVVFASIAVGVAWGSTGDADFGQAKYGAFTLSYTSGGDIVGETTYKGVQFDDEKGVGLIRSGAGLLVSGLIVLAVGVLAYEHQLFLRRDWIGHIGLGLGGLAFLLWLTGMILLPIGLAKFSESAAGPFAEKMQWGAGLVMAIFAGVFQLAAIGFAAARLVMAGGFKLELADSGGVANFD